MPQMRIRTAIWKIIKGNIIMFKAVKWLFFDVGSTLIDEHEAYVHRFRDIASQAGIPYELVSGTAVAYYRENKPGDKECAKHFGTSLPKWHTEDERLYPDAACCLAALSKKYKIGIIANQLPGTAERLARHGVLQYIDLVVSSAEEGVSKPDPRIFEIALNRSGCLPEECIMIGDRIDNDILPANQMGMHTIWIRQGLGQYWTISSKSETPDATVLTLTELSDLLL